MVDNNDPNKYVQNYMGKGSVLNHEQYDALDRYLHACLTPVNPMDLLDDLRGFDSLLLYLLNFERINGLLESTPNPDDFLSTIIYKILVNADKNIFRNFKWLWPSDTRYAPLRTTASHPSDSDLHYIFERAFLRMRAERMFGISYNATYVQLGDAEVEDSVENQGYLSSQKRLFFKHNQRKRDADPSVPPLQYGDIGFSVSENPKVFNVETVSLKTPPAMSRIFIEVITHIITLRKNQITRFNGKYTEYDTASLSPQAQSLSNKQEPKNRFIKQNGIKLRYDKSGPAIKEIHDYLVSKKFKVLGTIKNSSISRTTEYWHRIFGGVHVSMRSNAYPNKKTLMSYFPNDDFINPVNMFSSYNVKEFISKIDTIITTYQTEKQKRKQQWYEDMVNNTETNK